jgi:hypothetical protein
LPLFHGGNDHVVVAVVANLVYKYVVMARTDDVLVAVVVVANEVHKYVVMVAVVVVVKLVYKYVLLVFWLGCWF